MSGGIVRADLPAVQVKEGGLEEGERVGEGGVGGEEEGDSPQPGMKRAGGLPLNISCRVQRDSTKREKVEEGTS